MLRAFLVICSLISLPPGTGLLAQENQELRHAGFTVDSSRVTILSLRPTDGSGSQYMASFRQDAIVEGAQIFLRIPGQKHPYNLTINGFKCGSDTGGPNACEYRITPFLQDENLLLLEFESSIGVGQCLYCNDEVKMIRREAIHIRDLLVSQFNSMQEEALVRLHLYLKSYRKRSQESRILDVKIRDPRGNEVHREKITLSSLPAYGQETELFLDQIIASPLLWSPAEPLLYTAELTLSAPGSIRESTLLYFGMRNALFADSLVIINSDSISLSFPPDGWYGDFFNSSEKQKATMLETASFNAFPAGICLSECLLPFMERKGLLLLRRKSVLAPETHRPFLNSPSVVWVD